MSCQIVNVVLVYLKNRNTITVSKRISAILFFIIAISCTGCAVKAQRLNRAKLDSFFYTLSSHNKSMGSVAVSANGVVVYQKAIGYSQITGDVKTPANVKTKYRIGSISKMFTGTMIFQLIEEGKLNLATTLATYYPQVPNAAKITIGEMLSHRSGLHNFTSDSLYLTYNTKPKTEAEMLAIIQKEPSDFEPDSKFSYSNTNFVLLGYIVEKITGMPYAQALKKRITSKIGLADTYYGGKANSAMNEARSYNNFNSKWEQQTETDMSVPGGAGAIVSTPTDLCKFIEALFAGKLISEASLELMRTTRDGYGMAMFQTPFYEKKTYGHNGGIDGFTSVLAYLPDDKVAVAYTTNGTIFSVNDVLTGVLSIYFNKPYTMPDFKSLTLTSQELDKYLGNYSSKEFPLKIAVTKNNSSLVAQATGQGQFELETVEKDKFVFRSAGVVMQFDPANQQFTLTQGGKSYLFTKITP